MLYRPDAAEARDRLTTWWNGGDIGRPVLLVSSPRSERLEDVPVMPPPEGVLCERYTAKSLEFRTNLGIRQAGGVELSGEAIPTASPCLGPNCLALFLGCEGVEQPGTVWFRPCLEDTESTAFNADPDNWHWGFQRALLDGLVSAGQGKFMVTFPDLIEGLDTLAAMRGSQELLVDLIERPDWVHKGLARISELYHEYYDAVYERIKDETGGSHFWLWAPGKCGKFQCDFSAMISPDMFGEFMVPVLEDLCNYIPYNLYHWDGPGALIHHDHLLSVDALQALQWTPGAGAAPVDDPSWWPYYHKTVEAGKKMCVFGCRSIDQLKAMKREFGPQLKQFAIRKHCPTRAEAEEFIRTAYVD
ncbi:MAG: hypothetical protein HN742_17220 [Lentisphaerae bacterium]|jgi:hypothetical protein|nr:hypothetical protein [Lentisphaerota bacterium]MBT4816551.1 hypothetical protein [Lentisphaerota bacterium]MBT5606903.1 hypothetical protein [Lentisphaerota bacterium]MBT7055521.1 hypothetical protein [Lentisphaerota bacterium]MBT7843622.1 hypothetical protein [Lentisphaerota bacterium]